MSGDRDPGRIGSARAATLYDRLSGLYDRLFDLFEGSLRDEALRMLDTGHGEHVLELGVGTGRALVPIGERLGNGGLAVGLDLSRGMLQRASRRLAHSHAPPPVTLVRAQFPPIPLAPSSIDAVFMSFTLELFEPSVALSVLAECRRVLRPAGRLAVASLWRTRNPGLMERGYAWGHRVAPGVLDCGPIDLDDLMRVGGFELRETVARSLAGIPVRLALALPRPRFSPNR